MYEYIEHREYRVTPICIFIIVIAATNDLKFKKADVDTLAFIILIVDRLDNDSDESD